jgi:hypothetical protein
VYRSVVADTLPAEEIGLQLPECPDTAPLRQLLKQELAKVKN